jgi:hypothetical protein
MATITPGMVGRYLVGLGRVGGEAESAPGGVTRLLRPAGTAARHPDVPTQFRGPANRDVVQDAALLA